MPRYGRLENLLRQKSSLFTNMHKFCGGITFVSARNNEFIFINTRKLDNFCTNHVFAIA